MKKSDLEVPIAPFRGENSTHDALLFWPKSHNWLNDNNNNFLNEGGSEKEDAEESNLRAREDDAAAKELGNDGRANENNCAKRKAKATTLAEVTLRVIDLHLFFFLRTPFFRPGWMFLFFW